MSKAFKIVLTVCVVVLVLAVSGSMIYYFAFAKPANERAELEWEKEKQEKEEQQKKDEETKLEQEKLEKNIQEALKREGLANCLDGAFQEYTRRMGECYETYIEAWNGECERLGLKPDSALPGETADRLNEDYQNEIDRAEKAYENYKADCFKLWQD